MNRTRLFMIFLAALFTASCSPQAVNTKWRPHALSQEEISVRQNLTWANQAWTNDDKKYQQIKNSVDKKIASGIKPDVLRIKYGVQAEAQRESPEAQFAWAYAAWKTIGSTPTSAQRIKYLEGVPEALAHVAFPRSYAFARLRFLTESDNPGLRNLGERLTKRDPNDEAIKYQLMNVYDTILFRDDLFKSIPPGVRENALAYSQNFIHAHPENPSYRAASGSLHLDLWKRNNHNRQEGDQAIADYQEYLHLAPENDGWRKNAKYLIGLIQSQTK